MIDHVAGKPHIGTFVHYFNPKILQKIGFTDGYGGRREGPYAALVVNDVGQGLTLRVYLPGVSSMEFDAVPHADEVGQNVADREKGYWDWRQAVDAARAAKELT